MDDGEVGAMRKFTGYDEYGKAHYVDKPDPVEETAAE